MSGSVSFCFVSYVLKWNKNLKKNIKNKASDKLMQKKIIKINETKKKKLNHR